jgi:hypothetical protein
MRENYSLPDTCCQIFLHICDLYVSESDVNISVKVANVVIWTCACYVNKNVV